MPLVLTVFVFLTPFMSALALAEWLPLPLVLMLAVSPFVLVRSSPVLLRKALLRDAGYVLMFVLGCLAIVWSPLPAGQKSINYSAAVVVCYLLFLVVVRALTLTEGVSWRLIGQAANVSLTFLALAVMVEFVLASFFGVFYADVIPFAHADLNVANFIDERFKRPRAFAAEPGFTSLAFECLWPLTFLDQRKKRWQLPRQVLFALGFLLLGSAAGVGCLVFAAGVWWAVRSRDWLRPLVFVGVLATVLVPLALTEAGADALWALFGRKLDIFALDAAEGSDGLTVLDRLGTWAVGLDLIDDNPLGIGWGGLGQMYADNIYLNGIGTLNGSGMLSLPMDVAVAAGPLGLLAMLGFIGLRWRTALRSRHKAAGAVAVALMSVSLHHLFITEFQFPFLWLALALADRLVLGQPEASDTARADGDAMPSGGAGRSDTLSEAR